MGSGQAAGAAGAGAGRAREGGDAVDDLAAPDPAFDAALDAILVGGRRPVRIVLVEHDPAWARRFAAERERVVGALGAAALALEHIGSTAVPGLVAKPIVDMDLVVADPDDEAGHRPALERLGFVLRVREPGHRMFRTPAGDVHLHVHPPGSPAVRAHLALRDRLRADPTARERYAARKRWLAGQGEWPDMNHYARAKDDVIRAILGGA